MKLSQTAVYAIQACSLLSQSPPGIVVSCRQLANDGQMPTRFLLTILRMLVKKGLLRSTRGVEGGYVLERKPAEISLLDIVDAIEDPFFASPSETDFNSLPTKRLHDVLRHIDSESRGLLAAVSLVALRPIDTTTAEQPMDLQIADPASPDAGLAKFDSVAVCS